MGLDFAVYKNSYVCYVPNNAPAIAKSLEELPECKTLSYIDSEIPVDTANFAKFVDTLNSGRELAIVIGSSIDNAISAKIEKHFQEEIELSGIINFHSTRNSLVVKNRHGKFTVSAHEESGRTVEPCALFRLHNFQRDLVYLSGISMDSLAIGVAAYMSIFEGPLYGDLITDDALLVTGSMTQDRTMISTHCDHIGAKYVDAGSLQIQKLRLLDQNI